MFSKGSTFRLESADLPDFLDDAMNYGHTFVYARSDRESKPRVHDFFLIVVIGPTWTEFCSKLTRVISDMSPKFKQHTGIADYSLERMNWVARMIF
jgi:hypothetical protein